RKNHLAKEASELFAFTHLVLDEIVSLRRRPDFLDVGEVQPDLCLLDVPDSLPDVRRNRFSSFLKCRFRRKAATCSDLKGARVPT
ncbi:MAG: hypothetical protein WB689_30290, partial [Xanthobacteraceae bacterium]